MTATPAGTIGRLKSKETLQDHLQRHSDVYDINLCRVQNVVFGDRGDNGLAVDMKLIKTKLETMDDRLEAIESYFKWLIRIVLGTVVSGIIVLLAMNGPAIIK